MDIMDNTLVPVDQGWLSEVATYIGEDNTTANVNMVDMVTESMDISSTRAILNGNTEVTMILPMQDVKDGFYIHVPHANHKKIVVLIYREKCDYCIAQIDIQIFTCKAAKKESCCMSCKIPSRKTKCCEPEYEIHLSVNQQCDMWETFKRVYGVEEIGQAEGVEYRPKMMPPGKTQNVDNMNSYNKFLEKIQERNRIQDDGNIKSLNEIMRNHGAYSEPSTLPQLPPLLPQPYLTSAENLRQMNSFF